RWAAGLVQRRHRRAGARNSVRAGVLHVAMYEDLVRSHLADVHKESRPRPRASLDSRKHSAEARTAQVLDLSAPLPADSDLADIGNDDEPLAVHGERIRLLHVAREEEHEFVAGADSIARIRADDGRRVELRGLVLEQVQPEDPEAAVELLLLKVARLEQ